MFKKSFDKYTDTIIEKAISDNKLVYLLCGAGLYSINTPKYLGGDLTFSASETMKAIYRYYKKDQSICNLTENTFNEIFSRYRGEFIFNAISCLDYHMYCEKKGNTPFKMDCVNLLEASKNYFIQFGENYRQHPEIMDHLKLIDKDFYETHNQHII